MAIGLNLLNSNGTKNIASNFQRVEAALNDAVSRSGTGPNQMNVDFDMNGHDILNAGVIDVTGLTLDGSPLIPTELGFIPPNAVGAPQLIDGAASISKLETLLQSVLSFNFDTRALAIASFIPSFVNKIRLSGYYATGDLGGGEYKKVGSAPLIGFQSADGAYWAFVGKTCNPFQLGCRCDNSTDDSVALQLGATAGLVIFIPTDTRVTTSATITFAAGGGIVGENKSSSFLRSIHTTNHVIRVSGTDPCVFQNFRIEGYAFGSFTGKTAGAGIYVDVTAPTGYNSRSLIHGVEFSVLDFGIQFMDGVNWGVTDCYFADFKTAGVWVENNPLPDGGDSYITNCTFITTLTTGFRACIVQKNSGGLKVIGNKFLQADYGYIMSLHAGTIAPTQSTSILIVTSNSFEHMRLAHIYFNKDPAADASIGFSQVIIANNQLNGQGAGSYPNATPTLIRADGSMAISKFIVTNNILFLSSFGGVAVDLANVTEFFIGGNTFTANGGSSVGIQTAANANGALGANTYTNVTTPQSIGGSVAHYDRATLKGTGSAITTANYGPIFGSAGNAVSFAAPFKETPFVVVQISNGLSGGISAVRSGVSTTGFTWACTGIANNSNVSIEWEATGIL